MRRFILTLGAVSLIAACTPLGLYYKQGATVQSAADTETRCKVSALSEVPVRNVTQIIPGRHLPPRRVCNSAGVCHTKPGRFIPPEFITRDANEALRAKAVDLCMRQKGYEYIRLPACEPAVAKATPPAQTTRLPRLAASSCVVRSSGGHWQIVTPN